VEINYDLATVEGFGEEWAKFDQTPLVEKELIEIFENYFGIFPWQTIGKDAIGFDLGCGSGRWAKLVAPRVGRLFCIDASQQALEIAQKNLKNIHNCEFIHASVEDIPFEDNSMDFGYSLGVLHHIPNTLKGIIACVRKLKPGAPFLLYLYYAFDNKPIWYRTVWQISDILRSYIAKKPFKSRYYLSQVLAFTVYYPLSRISLLLEKMGFEVENFPLSAYRKRSFYTMKTDALDRFGTKLEKRFTQAQIRRMMENAGLGNIDFSSSCFWCAIGYKFKV
jgi:ubiquinone/menaquinone biosynthesis C-methylase UbiE